jgi:hypothetical protein
MTIKHWKLSLSKGGRRIALFVTTTDRMVEADLDGDLEESLIQTSRQYHRHGQTPEQDHRDLAIGALMTYASCAPYDLTHEHIEGTPDVPPGAPRRYIGGDRRTPIVPVWEEEQVEALDE